MAEKNFCLRPKYLDGFKCDGAACGALCCRNAWRIAVDAATYQKYLRLGHEVTRHLRADESGEKYFIVHSDACPFLTADNMCGLQRAHGEDYLSPVCDGYPRIVTRFENFWEVALSLTCPIAARLVLLQTEPLVFELTEPSEKILRREANTTLQGVPRDLAPTMVEVQLAMVEILQTRRLTLHERFARLKDFLAPDAPLTTESLPKKSLPAEFATVAENFLVNEIFLNVWPFRLDATVAENFRAFAAAYKIFERQALTARTVDELLTAAGKVSRLIDHDEDYLQRQLVPR